MSVSILRGDLLKSGETRICQQVNCHGVMNTGFAKQVRDRWPHVFERYRDQCAKVKSKRTLLGTFQLVEARDGAPEVVNIFGQYDYGTDGVFTDCSALSRAFRELNRAFAGKTLAFPYGFGCGPDGGEWEDVEQLLVTCLPDCDVRIYMK